MPQVREQIILALLYADDVALLAKNAASLQRALHLAYKWAFTNHMLFGIDKCGVITPPHSGPFELQNAEFPIVDAYKYSGMMVTKDGFDTALNIDYRVNKATKCAQSLRTLGFSPSGFHFRSQVKALHMAVRQTLEYGLAILSNITQDKIKALDNVLLQAMRNFLGVNKFTSKLALQAFFQVEPYSLRIMFLQGNYVARLMSQSHAEKATQRSMILAGQMCNAAIRNRYDLIHRNHNEFSSFCDH